MRVCFLAELAAGAIALVVEEGVDGVSQFPQERVVDEPRQQHEALLVELPALPIRQAHSSVAL